MLPYSKSVFFSIPYPVRANEFSACGNSVFCQSYFAAIFFRFFFFFSVYWKRLFQQNPSLWSVETDFPASGDRFFFFVCFFVQRLFLLVETVTETSGSEKKEHMLTNITDVLASGTHFTFYFIF